MLSQAERPAPDSRSALVGALPGLMAAGTAVAAAIVLWWLIRPLDHVTIDTDAAAGVVYFEHIVHGQRLESFWSTTPKPLLTLIYGLAWQLTGDWRSLTVLTIVAGAVSVGLAARLATRLGGAATGAIIVVALLAWPDFQLEVANANSFIWGLLLWLTAGVLITADRPHPWLAGVALLLGGLARTETVWLLAATGGVAAVAIFFWWRTGDRADLRTILPLLIGFLAIPLACFHDLVLTGNPLYWLGCPSGYTVLTYPTLKAVSPLHQIGSELAHYRPAAPIALLAVAGVVWLALNGRRAIAFAITCLVGGVLATLVVLASRAVYISVRYYQEADAAILLAAAVAGSVAIGWLARALLARIDRARGGKPRLNGPIGSGALAIGLGAVLALSVVAVDVPHDALMPIVDRPANAFSDLSSVLGEITPIVAGARGGTMTVEGVGYPVTDPSACVMFVPRGMIPAISMETGVPIDAIVDAGTTFRGGDYSAMHAGQWVLHFASVDGRGGFYSPFERSTPGRFVTNQRAVELMPVIADPTRGIWLIRVDPATA